MTPDQMIHRGHLLNGRSTDLYLGRRAGLFREWQP